MPSAEQAVAGGSLEQSEVIKMALHPALGVKTHELKRRTGLASTPRGSPSETEQELDHCVLLISANGVLSFFFFFNQEKMLPCAHTEHLLCVLTAPMNKNISLENRHLRLRKYILSNFQK